MRSLGDSYVRSEFRLHSKTTNPQQLSDFFNAWGDYCKQLQQQQQQGEGVIGQSLDEESVKLLNDEQKSKLAELRESAFRTQR